MPMPKQLTRDAYCSAPPLSTTTLQPPRLSRDVEARRPRAPLTVVKREIESSETESVEFVVDKKFEIDVKPRVGVELDPRQLRAEVTALLLRPTPSSASTSSGEGAAAPGPSKWSHRTAALCCIPSQSLGPADPPRGRGRPKGSKSRPRIVFVLMTMPERAAKLKAEVSLAGMKSSKQV